MGPEGGTNIVFRKEIAAAPDPDAERAKKVERPWKKHGVMPV